MVNPPDRLLILSSSVGRGGADRQLLNLAYRLRERRFQIKIVSLSPLGVMGYEGIENGLDISCIDLKKRKSVLPGLAKILALAATWKPKLVLTFMFHAGMVGRLLKLFSLAPRHVSSVRNERIGGRRREKVFRLTAFLDDYTTTNSRNAAESLVCRNVLDKRRTVVVPNSVDVTRYERDTGDRWALRDQYGIDRSRFVWIIVARMVENKDYGTLFEAMAALVRSGMNPLLRVVGVGRLFERTRRMVRDMQLDDCVEFLGARTDIPDLLNASDGFVLSSAWEGMPNVILEAMSASLPVVATNVGGVSELVIHRRTGYLVEPGDAHALYEAMKAVMDLKPEERAEMGRKAHAFVSENHSLSSIADMWIDVFRRRR